MSTKREKKGGRVIASAQTHICFHNQCKVGSPFQISVVCVIKRLHLTI